MSPQVLASLARPSVGCRTVDYEGNRAPSGRITGSKLDRAGEIIRWRTRRSLRRSSHPDIAQISRQRISTLYDWLPVDDGKAEAAEAFRTLLDQVTLVPDGAELAIVLRGDLAAILRFAAGKKNPDSLSQAGVLDGLLSQASVVAGVGFEPVIVRLCSLIQVSAT